MLRPPPDAAYWILKGKTAVTTRRRLGGCVGIVAAGALTAALALTGCTAAPEGAPDGLPRSVPVVEGVISSQVSLPEQGNWSFSVEVADAGAQQATVRLMVDKGWELIGKNEASSHSTFALQKGPQNASVLFTDVDGKPNVLYNIIDTAKAEGGE